MNIEFRRLKQTNLRMLLYLLLVCVSVRSARSDNSTMEEDSCQSSYPGPFSQLLEEWAITEPAPNRQGRILALPPTTGYYVTERIDTPLVPPPPRPHRPSQGPPQSNHVPTQYHGPQTYKEWEAPPPPGGKIVNRPPAPSPYKDKYKPNYSPAHSGSHPQSSNSIDRLDDPPRKQVTETDLYLLGAIEKLVYRVDLMEKRLRKVEEGLHHLVVGTETKPEPCESNFTRVGEECYWWSSETADWKGASIACRKRHAALLELRSDKQHKVVVSKILADRQLKGVDFWTGGLNPGLLWIWSQSARPVEGSGSNSSVPGEGRCLALVHDAARAVYHYRGQDCALAHRYVCQLLHDEGRLANEIERVARDRKLAPSSARHTKLLPLWDDRPN
ncbi:uncharacterized protein LOC126979442 isoform X2 [Leptidea sinapis]|uniref:uncharacterized protein LOC126979442 isoform X2 n=1 Tax=Leptidea sinapis TaxID=189913 RepID=UPI0021C320DD|nr:uncharacterized protein LOC126979442 isoform X2 [Leptidea sinapis]